MSLHRSRSSWIVSVVTVLAVAWTPLSAQEATATSGTKGPRFGSAITKFQQDDLTNPPPSGAILFIGSSVFRQWTNVAEQMKPLPVFNRAFGGSRTSDVLYWMKQVVLPYKPRIIVYYCGSNDINGGLDAEQVVDGFRQFVTRVHAELPTTRIFYVSINKAPQKLSRMATVDEANAKAKTYCESNPLLAFIDVNSVLCDENGAPKEDLFQSDKLHLKPETYERLAAIIHPILTAAWESLQ